MLVVSYYFVWPNPASWGSPVAGQVPCAMAEPGTAVPVRVQVSGAAALTELDMRVRHWLTRCTAAGGPEYQTTVRCSYMHVVWHIGLSVPGAGAAGCCGLPASAGIVSAWTGTCRLVVFRLAGTAPAQACAAGGHVCSTQQGWLHPARVACPLGQVPAGARCLGSRVLRLHGRVLLAAVSGPRSKGARVWSTRCSSDQCSGVPGSSWRDQFGPPSRSELDWRHAATRTVYARHSGLMLGNVPGHVLSHVCGLVRSMCPILGMSIFKHIDRDALYM